MTDDPNNIETRLKHMTRRLGVCYYMLDDEGEPFATDDVLEWGEWFETSGEKRIVANDIDEDTKIRVSTVFLGLDHNFGFSSEPVLWETMTFAGEPNARGFFPELDWGHFSDRYTSKALALAGHRRICAEVAEEIKRRKGGTE